MKTIFNGNNILLKWYFTDAITGTDFSFDNADTRVVLYSHNYRRELNHSIEGNIIQSTIPSHLPIGIYSLECTYWVGIGAKRANVVIHEAFQVTRNTGALVEHELNFYSVAMPIFTTKIATVEYITEKRYKELEASQSLGKRTLYVVITESGEEKIYLYNKPLGGVGGVVTEEERDKWNKGIVTEEERDKWNKGIVTEEERDKWNKGVGGESYTADEEDITLSPSGSGTGKVYRFKDRDTSKGMGHVILRSNKTLAEQMLAENTIYEIRYDFNLNGETLHFPKNSVLRFNGGCIKNGNIVGETAINVVSDGKIFDNIALSENSRFVNNEINPTWFGVVGDGVTDDTGAINSMLSVCKNIYRRKINVRNAVDSSPRIRFSSSGNNVRITSPITIDFLCNILGNPTFLYDGDEIENGGAIIINKQYNTTFEFSIAKYYSTETVDLSSEIKFAGVKTIDCVWCNFNIHQIYGFYRGVYMLCDGYGTWQCTFNVHYISFCIDAFVCNTINSGWSNGNIIRDTIFLGQTGDIILADNQKEGAFLRFIGDGSYGANSWIIENIQCETRLNKNLAIRFIHIQLDSPNLFQDFSIQNIRLEEIGFYMMVSNCEHRRWTLSHVLYKTSNNIYLTKFGIDTTYSNKILEGYGINYLGTKSGYTRTRNYELAKNKHYYCGRYYDLSTDSRLIGLQKIESNVDELSNFARPSEMYELLPGQTIKITKAITGRIYIIIFNSEGTRIDFPSDDILFQDTALDLVQIENYKHYLYTITDAVNSAWINNISETSYRVAFLVAGDYEINSNIGINLVKNIPSFKKRGTTEERPSLTNVSTGYEYYDTTLNTTLLWNGNSWVNAIPVIENKYKDVFNYLLAKDLTFDKSINAYVRNNLCYAITGVDKDTLISTTCDRFGMPAKRYKISAGQTINIKKWNSSTRIYIVFFSEGNTHTAVPSEISYGSTLASVTSGEVTFLQTNSDLHNSVNISNIGENDIIFSILCTADFEISSEKYITNIEIVNWLKKSGTTEERPAVNINLAGWIYYDSTLKKSILCNGTNWVNLDGTAL